MTNRITAILSFRETEDYAQSDLPYPSIPSSALRDLVAETGKSSPRVALLATASGDSDHDVANFYRQMAQLNCRASDLSITHFNYTNPEELINSQEILYITDGSGPNLVALWRSNNLDKLVARAALNGAQLYAENEGASALFEAYDSRARGQVEIREDGLGIIPGTLIRHSIEQDITSWGFPAPIFYVYSPVTIGFRPSISPYDVSAELQGEVWLYDSRAKRPVRVKLPTSRHS